MRVPQDMEIAGLIFARAHASAIGRNRCEVPHAAPSARVKMGSEPSLPAVSVANSLCPSSVKTTRRGSPRPALADCDDAGVGVEIGNVRADQFGISASGQ
jgi:hypothetical protein